METANHQNRRETGARRKRREETGGGAKELPSSSLGHAPRFVRLTFRIFDAPAHLFLKGFLAVLEHSLIEGYLFLLTSGVDPRLVKEVAFLTNYEPKLVSDLCRLG